jgi:hypothetical protein
MTKLTIGPNSPFRRAFDGLDTYYSSKGEFVSALRAALDAYNDSPDGEGREVDVVCHDMDGREGYNAWALRPKNTAHAVCECCAEKAARATFDNVLVVTHYLVRAAGNGRPDCYEFVVYVSI